MKDILVRAKVVPLKNNKACCRSSGGTRFKICKHVKSTETFRSFCAKRQYWIKSNNLNCCFSNVVYLLSYKSCSKKYTGSSENFRSRFNNYKSTHRNFIKGIPSNKRNFTLTLRNTNIMVWVIVKLVSFTKQIV